MSDGEPTTSRTVPAQYGRKHHQHKTTKAPEDFDLPRPWGWLRGLDLNQRPLGYELLNDLVSMQHLESPDWQNAADRGTTRNPGATNAPPRSPSPGGPSVLSKRSNRSDPKAALTSKDVLRRLAAPHRYRVTLDAKGWPRAGTPGGARGVGAAHPGSAAAPPDPGTSTKTVRTPHSHSDFSGVEARLVPGAGLR